MRRVLAIGLALSAAVGCSDSPPVASIGTGAAAVVVPPRVTLAFTSVTPERLALSGDRLAPQTLDVAYTIPDPATVEAAKLTLYIRGIGNVATMPVTVEASGRARLEVPANDESLGAVVRFRASCQEGVTDWYTMGQIPLGYTASRADVFRIAQVNPQWLPVPPPVDPTGTATNAEQVTIYGPRLTPDCRIEADADGSPIELRNVNFVGGDFRGLLQYRDIGFKRVLHRFAELKLSIKRTGWFETIQQLAFDR